MSNALPFPAEELRDSALTHLNLAEQEISRIRRFFRGHQKDCTVLDSLLVRLASARISLTHLEFPSTNCEEKFPELPR